MINDYKELSHIYFIRNRGTGEFYIGSSIDADKRYAEHIALLKHNKHRNYKLQNSYNKCSDFYMQSCSIEVHGSSMKEHRDLAFEFEDKLIKEHINNPLNLNIATSAYNPNNFGRKHTIETKNKQSISAKKRWMLPDEKERQSVISKQYHASLSLNQKYLNSKRMTILNERFKTDPVIKQKQIEGSRLFWNDQKNKENQSVKRKNFFKNGGYKYQLTNKFTDTHKENISKGKKKAWSLLNDSKRKEWNQKRAEGMKKLVKVGDKIYTSRMDAAAGEKISPPTVKFRIDSANFPEWNWI